MAATTTATTTHFTVTVDGQYGPHPTKVPVECPSEAKLRALGGYYLAAYATRYPLAQQVLAEKQAREAKLEADAAERDAAKAAKAKAKASTGNEPGAVDTAKRSTTPPATTEYATTLRTATVAQLVAELVSRHATDDALDTLGNAVGDAIDAARAKLEKPATQAALVTPPAKEEAPTVKLAPAAPVKPQAPAMAAQVVKVDAPKATQEKAEPAPAWTDATIPTTHKAVVALGKDRLASLATWLGVGIDGMTFANAAGAVWSGLKAAEPTKAGKPAPKAKAKAAPVKPAPKTAPADPIVPGLFDASGKPVTLSQVKAALEAFTATTAKMAA